METPYSNLIGRELEVPTVQGTITGLPLSYRGYRRDTTFAVAERTRLPVFPEHGTVHLRAGVCGGGAT